MNKAKPKDKLLTVKEVMDAVQSCSFSLRGMIVLDVPAFYDKLRGVEPKKCETKKPPLR